jgi:hypothetical protein
LGPLVGKLAAGHNAAADNVPNGARALLPAGLLALAAVADHLRRRLAEGRPAWGRDLWLLGSGTGIAPFLSILQDFEVWQRFARIVLAAGPPAFVAEAAAAAAPHREALLARGVVFIPFCTDGSELPPDSPPAATAAEKRWRADPLYPAEWTRWLGGRALVGGVWSGPTAVGALTQPAQRWMARARRVGTPGLVRWRVGASAAWSLLTDPDRQGAYSVTLASRSRASASPRPVSKAGAMQS